MYITEKKDFDNETLFAIANEVIKWFHNKGKSINNLYLQKILYYLQINYMIKYDGEKLFENIFEKWKLGPVQPEVYHEFKLYGPNDIKNTHKELEVKMENGNLKVNQNEIKLNSNNMSDKKKKEFIEAALPVLSTYGKFQLVDLTHEQEIWKKDEPEILNGVKNIEYDYNELIDYFKKHTDQLLLEGI